MDLDGVDQLWRAVQVGELDPTELLGRWTLDEGQERQLAVLDRWCDQGDALAGWKVGCTSGKARDQFGPGVRPFGHVLRSRVFRSGDAVVLDPTLQARRGIETEICFRIGAAINGPDVTAADLRAVVAGVCPAFELNQDRLTNKSDASVRAADNMRHWGIVVGPELAPVPPDFDWDAIVSVITHNDASSDPVHALGHIDDHFDSLAALVRQLSKFGRGLQPDELVITGAFVRIDGPELATYVGSFTGLGEVAVTFTSG